MRPSSVNEQSRQRQARSAMWFTINRRGGNLIVHHRHLRPVLARDWAPRLDGITATIFASQTTIDLRRDPPGTAACRDVTRGCQLIDGVGSCRSPDSMTLNRRRVKQCTAVPMSFSSVVVQYLYLHRAARRRGSPRGGWGH